MISGGGVEEERNYEMAMDGTILLRRFVGSGWVTRFDFYLRRNAQRYGEGDGDDPVHCWKKKNERTNG